MKTKLGSIHTQFFDNFLIIALDKKWVSINNEKPLEFDIELKNGKLILSSTLASLDRTRSVVVNDM